MTTTTTAPTPTPAPPAAVKAQQHWLERVVRARELGLALLIVALVAGTSAVNRPFLFSSDGWRSLLTLPTILIVVAVGQAAVIITRNIDLSVGSTMGLCTYFAGNLFHQVSGIPTVVVVILSIALGAAIGLVNGLLVALLKVPSLVITLGMLYAIRGVDVLWVGGNFIRPEWLPDSFQKLSTAELFGIPYLFILTVPVVLVVSWYLRNRRGGREFYALGSDPDAAVLYGLDTRKITVKAFVLSGALAGLAGTMYLAIYVSGDSQVGTNLEFETVAAAVVGGIAITGGSGAVWVAALGAFLLGTINSALPVLGIPSLWQQAFVGAFILGAIALDRALFVTRARRARALRSHA
ncbi:ABC transporter permease [Luteimicrobium xylanilyticum]|uniref:Autoinducer 2 import system permease protein LsrC n=1 Tax=Luteimicrobium xylanilyticum TaxID=1133546 RepID=A0A5P9Q6X4_9MICO|nr:ABC transporter permease [Luteimicrobium xylanilyticum]QFU97163.1 Autoinducer 2 import system permease protein LsrC [Luteimicrobium xylanilyticum]